MSLGVSVLFLVLGLPLMLGKVKRNNYYGARFRATLADDRVWDVVNRRSGLLFVVGGGAGAMIDLLALGGIVTKNTGLYVAGGLAAYVLVASIWLWRYSEQLAREVGITAGRVEVGTTTPLVVAIGCFAVAVVGAVSAFSTPNPWLGFRVPATLADPLVWHEVNLKAGLTLAVLSGVFGFMFLGLRGMTESERKRLFSGLLIGWVICIIVVAVAGSFFAAGLAR